MVCIPSAGITVKQNYGKIKYIGTNSTSFSIPVITGLFAMARQVNPKMTLKQFSEICRQTAKEENGYMVVSPKTMIRAVSRFKKEDKKISIEDAVRNEITQSVTTEDIKRVKRVEKTNDKDAREL